MSVPRRTLSHPSSHWLSVVLLVVTVVLPRGEPARAAESTPEKTHWSLRPVQRPVPPLVANKQWKTRNPVDQFIFQKLAEAKLAPSIEAPRRTLPRRLYFDLTGLPPTAEEVQAFERDRSADAYERLVDRLLASPHYGERWGQHWLDVVRFAETHGFEMNQPRANAWVYRDYVIRSFNQDKPYDRFLTEQLAGDCLGEDAATGFLVAGPWDQVKSPDPVLTAAQRADELHDMVSTVSSAFLGLTVGCARCHHHKFDPVPQTDYYAIKACFAGVQHGERKLRTAESAARDEEARSVGKQLEELESTLSEFEPLATTEVVRFVEPEPAFGSRLARLLKPAKTVNFQEGTARGERQDPGDVGRLPNFSRACLSWSNSAHTPLISYQPGLAGRHRLWVSWGCGIDALASDARYVLDRDGDLSTTNDQAEIAQVDQRHFSDGTEGKAAKPLWSGFYHGGAWDLSESNAIVLIAGSGEGVVTAGILALIPEPAEAATEPAGNGATLPPLSLRGPVNARRNIERFPTVKAKRLRFTITRTTDAEPCLDELEVFSAQSPPVNVALASAGASSRASSVFPNSDIHRLEHIQDGKFGNSRSWISNERSNSWVELEFAEETAIQRVVWARDREQKFTDRLPLDYRIEVAVGSNDWRLVASSRDRVPYVGDRPSSPGFGLRGLSQKEAERLKHLLAERNGQQERLKELANGPMVYGGQLTDKPEPTHRLQRGDPMLKREVVAPAGLSALALSFNLNPTLDKPELTDDQRRRLTLANWIAHPDNPLPSRVIVNRIWQHHFGEGLVTTPSDFGHKGAAPSHPELLDWLASELVHPLEKSAASWSLKHIHRLVVSSATYRQAVTARPEALATDAGCRLLWRFPPRRLDAEALRDAILSVSGKLSPAMGGPGFSTFETNDNYVRVYVPKKEFGPSDWRRMVYMTKVRMQRDGTFGAFDCPDGGQIAPRRMRSTTPLQALNLLNSPFMIEQAAFMAQRLEQEAGPKLKAQVTRGFQLAYNRAPEPAEARAAVRLAQEHGLNNFCRALLNSSEFVFLE